MTPTTLAEAYAMVDNNFDQTFLVNRLLDEGLISQSLIEYEITDVTEEDWEDEELEGSIDIYGWLVFPSLIDSDYEKLIQSGIPVLKTDYGNWVGTTSYGSPYDLQIYPELIYALFSIETNQLEIQAMKKNR